MQAPSTPNAPPGDVVLRCALWLLLGSWIGAWLLFGAVVAPASFRVLPTTELAGQVVGPVLTALHLYGAFAGIALAILAWAMGRGALLGLLPLAMGVACLYSHFGVSAEMAEIRSLAFGPGGSAEIAGRFNQLHQRSLAIYLSVGFAAIALLILHVREDVRATAARR